MKNKEFFKSIVELTSDIIWEVDENWCYTYISGKVKEYMGYTADELIGKMPLSLMTDDETEKIKNKVRIISSRRGNLADIEIKVFNKKKDIRYLMINGMPILDSEKKFRGYRGVVRDVTDKKLAESAYKESENHLSTLMNNLPGMAYRGSFTNGFKMEFVSEGAYALSGYTPSVFVEKGISSKSIIYPDDIKMVKTTVRNALNDKKQYDVIFRIISC